MATVYPDASALDAVVLGVLQGDAILAALVPDGVFWGIAPPGSTAFGIVTLSDFSSELMMSGLDGVDEHVYDCKVTARTTGGTTVRDAAARIHDLLHLQPLALEGSGFELMIARRIRRIRYTEHDPADPSVLWQHRGGAYAVKVSL